MGRSVGVRDGETVGVVVGERDIDGAAVGAGVGGIRNASYMFLKSTDPNPVTGSHPTADTKPCVQHLVAIAVQKLCPKVTSFTKDEARLYSSGCIHPSSDIPMAFLAAFINAIMPPNTGADADVPDRT